VEIDLGAPGAGRHAADLARGGLFVPGEELELATECDVRIHGGERPVVVVARVVFADGNGIGVHLELDAALRAELIAICERAPQEGAEAAWPEEGAAGAEQGAPAYDEPVGADDDGGDAAGGPDVAAEAAAEAEAGRADEADAAAVAGRGGPKNVYERLRGLTLVQQYRIARAGELHERVALERIYGKTVWEQLLRNPKISPPEVARIARMGNLPRPLVEIIVANAVWLGVPEVRRALLTNPRLSAEMIPRILRYLPKHELKLVPSQLSYTLAVREVARRMLKATPI